MDTRKLFEGMSEESRRLPVYLVLDVSGSMAGEKIQAVERGVRMMWEELLKKPEAVDTVHLKLILFNSGIDERRLVSLQDFSPPPLSAGGGTSMGAALRTLNDGTQFSADLIKNSKDKKGDYLPLVFILTDGQPTDDYAQAASVILARTRGRSTEDYPRLNVFAIAVGLDANTQMLHEITDEVLLMQNATGPAIMELFKWITATTGLQSRSVTAAGQGAAAPAQAPEPPREHGIMYAD